MPHNFTLTADNFTETTVPLPPLTPEEYYSHKSFSGKTINYSISCVGIHFLTLTMIICVHMPYGLYYFSNEPPVVCTCLLIKVLTIKNQNKGTEYIILAAVADTKPLSN